MAYVFKMDTPPLSYYQRNREAILAKTKEKYYARTPAQRNADRIKNAETQRRLRGKTTRKPGPIVFAITTHNQLFQF